jgi:hypothetical protein
MNHDESSLTPEKRTMNQSLRRYMTSAVAEEVQSEIDRSEEQHGPFHSLHEGLAVLREEYQELEQEIFWGYQRSGNTDKVRREAIQVAAMAIRIAIMLSPVPLDVPDDSIE